MRYDHPFHRFSSTLCMVSTNSRVWIDPGKVANLARGQLNRKISFSLSPFAPAYLVSRDGFGRLVPRQPAHCQRSC